ncbi:MAG: hypothetical protein VB055_09345 [Oscillospiraceae bacterium]|nr:hypothetical protein [Oscillospiraceae bacterium]
MANKQEFEDDGRTVANMNVEGMPWYLEKKEKPETEKIELTKEEGRSMMWGILKASLLVAGVFIAGFTIFILLCVFVFFR